MGHLDPTAYTYDADVHCPACARYRFPGTRWPGIEERITEERAEWLESQGLGVAHRPDTYRPDEWDFEYFDSEGNTIHPLAPWDEWIQGGPGCETLVCGTCGGAIESAHDPDAEECTCAEFVPQGYKSST